MPALTQQGINALKLGDKAKAQKILKQATIQNPQDTQAWLWLSGAAENNQERLKYLQKVLEIDPDNIAAAKGLAKLITNGVAHIQIKNTETLSQNIRETNSSSPQEQKNTKEKILFKVKPSIIPFVVVFVITVFLLVGMSLLVGKVSSSSAIRWLLGFILFVSFGTLFWKIGISFLKSLFARYILTTKYLIVKTGVFSHSQKTIPIHRIQDVSFQQTFLLRPFGVGNVIVESAGERGEIKLMALADFQKRSRQILHVIDKFR